MKKYILLAFSLSLFACTPVTTGQEAAFLTPATAASAADDGVVNYIWEEPMVDVVDVPPGLDPEGMYYRPGHRAVVEIRQGRWEHYE